MYHHVGASGRLINSPWPDLHNYTYCAMQFLAHASVGHNTVRCAI